MNWLMLLSPPIPNKWSLDIPSLSQQTNCRQHKTSRKRWGRCSNTGFGVMYLYYINNRYSVTVIHMKWFSIHLMDDLGLYNQGKIGLCSLPVSQKVKTRQLLVRMLSHCANVHTSPNVEEQALMLVIYCLQCPHLIGRRWNVETMALCYFICKWQLICKTETC